MKNEKYIKVFMDNDLYKKIQSCGESEGISMSSVLRNGAELYTGGMKPDKKLERETVNYNKLSKELKDAMQRIATSNMSDRNAEDIINEILRVQKVLKKIRGYENG